MACTGHEAAGFDILKLHTSFSDTACPSNRPHCHYSKPGNETGHQEQMTTSQSISANQAKRTKRQTAWVRTHNPSAVIVKNATRFFLSPWFESQSLSTFKQAKLCTYMWVLAQNPSLDLSFAKISVSAHAQILPSLNFLAESSEKDKAGLFNVQNTIFSHIFLSISPPSHLLSLFYPSQISGKWY